MAVAGETASPKRTVAFLGPAFVAAIAYVDPGNVAANLTGGAAYGYLLVWVIVLSNLMAMMVQYQSAKLGLVTGSSLPELLGTRLRPHARRAYWVQAEITAMATDLAEVIGGAIALNLLFGTPLPLGGLIVGLVSMAVLSIQNRYGQRPFEAAIVALLAIITVGFLSGLIINPPDPLATVEGLVPRLNGSDSVLLAASMLGATVMPHAIYLHSALARDRHRANGPLEAGTLRRLLHITRLDVIWALVIAGSVNLGMLLLAASSLGGADGTDSIEGAHAAIGAALGPAVAAIFAIGLLASGLASTTVGCYAGASIMSGLLTYQLPLLARRAISMVPAVGLLLTGVDPTRALVISQVILSFGIPFALIPLLWLTSRRSLMGEHRDGRTLRAFSAISALLIILLNLTLIYLTISGTG